MATVLHSAPRFASNEGVRDALVTALGGMVLSSKEQHGEIVLTVARDCIEDALRTLRDEHDYQQLMEIAGADYPSRPERFEVVYMLLSLTKNHRVMVKCTAAEHMPVPTVTTLWPVAGWLEREVFDMFGVVFAGNTDLRRILTDYGFEGHPFRKDFPLTGYTELRYSEDEKRVVYQPVDLPQDLRQFDFMSPWEGADYVLPGDEKVAKQPDTPPVHEVKTTERPDQTGAGEETDKKAAEHVAPAAPSGTVPGQGQGDPAQVDAATPAPGAPEPTESRPRRKPRQSAAPTEVDPKPRRARKPKGDGA
jgi:NADH-quinone oxidoreductase subunit C